MLIERDIYASTNRALEFGKVSKLTFQCISGVRDTPRFDSFRGAKPNGGHVSWQRDVSPVSIAFKDCESNQCNGAK
jgi:hypothetical protein